MRHPRRGVLTVHRSLTRAAVVGCLAAAALAGCGSSDDDAQTTTASGSATTTSGGGDSVVAEARAAVESAEAPVTGGVPSDSPPAARDKFVVLIPCTQAGEGCAEPARGAAEAARALGWRAQTIDGQGTPDNQSAAIEQAITLNADAIITFAIDPSTVRGAARAARAAGIPVIGSSSTESPLLAFSNLPTKEDWEESGKLAAQYLIAETDGRAKVLEFTTVETKSVTQRTDAFERELAKCEACEILDSANFTFADIASTVPSLAQQMAQANPEFNSVFVSFDAAVPSFLQGFRAVGATDKLMVSGDGSSQANACIASGCGLSATVAFPLKWIGWADVDAANRVFAGTDPAVAAADLPVKLLVRDNAPSDGPWDGDYDFEAAYKSIWGVG